MPNQLRLEDLIDISLFQELQEKLDKLISFPSSIIDNDGNILTGVAWQAICTKFHRAHSESEAECIKSDKYILKHLNEANPYVSYKCPHGLIDVAFPIIIDGQHFANFFTGQFFLKEPDIGFFKEQAVKYGYDEKSYLEAVRKVPVWPKEKFEKYIDFIKNFIEIIANTGLNRIREKKNQENLLKEKQKAVDSEEKYRMLVDNINELVCEIDSNGIYTYLSPNYEEIIGYKPNELLGKAAADLIHPDDWALSQEKHEKINMNSGTSVDVWRFLHKNGTYRYIESRGKVYQYSEKEKRAVVISSDITEKKEKEDLLKKSSIIINSTTDLVITTDLNGIITYTNRAVMDLYQYAEDELIGKPVSILWKEEDNDGLRNLIGDLMQGKVVKNMETYCLDKSGNEIPILMSLTGLTNSTGEVVELMGISKEISSVKNAQYALIENEEKYRNLVETASDAIYLISDDGKIVDTNESACQMLGKAKQEIVGALINTVDPNYPVDQFLGFWKDIPFNKQFIFETSHQHQNGSFIPVEVSGIKYKQHGDVFFYGIARDITERKKAEKDILNAKESAEENEEKYRLLHENAGLGIGYYTTEGVVLSYNTIAARRMNGVPGDFQGKSIFDLFPREDAEEYMRRIQRAIKTDDIIEYEDFVDLPSEKKWFLSTFTKIKNSNGRVLGVQIISHDITDRKEAEEKLKESEEKFKAFTEQSAVAIYVTDIDGDCIYVNDCWKEMSGMSSDEAMGKGWINALHPEDRNDIREKWYKSLESDGKWSFEYRIVDKQENITWVEGTVKPMYNHKHQRIGYLGSNVNITDRKLAEGELIKMKNLKSIGTLAGGIAHDFNNILAGIYGNISLALEDLDHSHPSYELISDAEKSINRATKLTHQLLTFSKGGTPVKQEVVLTRLIEETVNFDLSGSQVKPVFEFAENLLNANADKGQLHQVFSNLTINAMQASPNGGHLFINVSNCLLKEREITDLESGHYLKITVRDEGTGIPKDHIDKVFEPYFTTKQKGSGLGLAITYSIIKKHHGHLEIHSELGKGTTFTIYLPAIESKGIQDEHRVKSNDLKIKHGSKILIMDDDRVIRKMLSQIIKRMGFKTELVQDGRSAISKYKDAILHKDPFDVVILDLTIPGGMGGKETVKEILKLNDQAKVIVSSGYAGELTLAEYKSYGFVDMIRKPYTISELKKILYRVIGNEHRMVSIFEN